MASLLKGTRTTRFERYYPYLRFLRDLAFSLADIFSQCTTIRPWHLIFPVLALKALVVISYTYGNNVDHHIPKGVDGLVVIRGPRGCYLFEGDRDEVEREKRMGVLGHPVGDVSKIEINGTANGPINGTVKIGLATTWKDQDRNPEALQRVHQSLRKQSRRPDLVVFVDDGTPMLRDRKDTSPTKKSSSLFDILSFARTSLPRLCHDPYESLETGIETHVVRLPENRGPAAARNKGIDHAIAALGNDPGHTMIFLLGLDCVAPEDWIGNGVTAVLVRRPGLLDGTTPVEPLLVGGLTFGTNPSSFYSFYHDLFGTLNPRIIRVPDPNTAQFQPLYTPTCNMVILPGDADCRKKLPRFHEGFGEAAQEDVLFCLEAVYGRGCELVMDNY
ncbi:hypothetical protein QFC20_002574 [Naganishia adeliensis]|uniref:Uncharacterized protein n=1 Tax=Naganishia adeliensis TaxID=92952 RepID=A0ACC2WII3_9TREE|nr:hypothetical protein QFC20_002574 [Naganishia adeliensis]